jgi:DNA-binding PadR family transcriptional regulator
MQGMGGNSPMPAKLDYLRDLRANPRSTSAQVLPRVQAPTLGAVETAFRKYADDKLVESDDSKPKLYTLTDKGAEELRKLESEAPNAQAVTVLPMRREESDLIGALAKCAKQEGCRISFSLEPESQHRETSEEQPDLKARADALLKRVRALNGESEPDAPSVPWDDPKVQQLYALQLGMSDLPRRVVRGRRDSLAEVVGPETADLIAQLVSREEQLADEGDSFWGDQDEADRLQKEIAELRSKLGCSEEEDAEETQEGEAEQTDSEKRADDELLGR